MKNEGKKTKTRSPNFPAISLPEAIDKTKAIYNADGRSGSPKLSAYKHLGYKGEHGASLGVLSAMKKYGLIKEENDRIFLTKNSEFILLSSDESKKLEIIQKCALTPDIYSQLWGQYSDTGLPSDSSLKDILLFDYNFNEKSVEGFIKDFRATIEFAHLKPSESFESGREEQEQMEEIELLEVKDKKGKLIKDFAIPRIDNKEALLRLELPVSKGDIDIIIQWLNVLRSTLVSESPK